MSAEEEIWTAIVEVNRAWKGGNSEALASFFHQDAVLVFANSPRRVVGRDAVVREYAEFARRIEIVEFRELQHSVEILGETAVANYRFRLTYEANGVPHEETGREVLVFRRAAPGSWLAIWRAQFPEREPTFDNVEN